jgi:signal transduction histidine kinase
MNLASMGPYAPTDKLAIQQLRQERGWKLWLAPRPFTLVSSTIYLLLIALSLLGDCTPCQENPWAIVPLFGVLITLLALDRVDYWLFGEVPPAKAAIVLLAVRLLLVEGIAQFGGLWTAMWLYALLPYIASLYFQARGALLMSAIVWTAFVVRTTLAELPLNLADPDQVGEYVNGIAIFSFLLVFVVTMARIVQEEKAGRARAERLLMELEGSHSQLKEYSMQVIATTEGRNRIARDIHDTLGHYLAVINVQLEKALAFRERDPQAADQAVRDAKHLGSEALHDVRRSVGALRSNTKVAHPPQTKLENTPSTRRRGWKFWLAPRPFDAVTTSIYIAVVLMDLAWSGGDDWNGNTDTLLSWRSLLWVAIALALISLDRIDFWLFGEVPPTRAGILLLALRFLLIVAVGLTAGPWYTLWLFPFLVHTGFSYFGNRGGYGIAALISLILLLFIVVSTIDDASRGEFNIVNLLSGLVMMSLLVLLVIATSKTVLKERASRRRAEDLLEELKVAHEQLKLHSEQALAAVQERNHLARDIHDSLGHYLTVINVQLEKALAFRDIDPQVADLAIRDSKRMSGEALQEVRGTMSALRTNREAFLLIPTLQQLVGNVGGNLEVDLRINGREDGFSKQSLVALYRAAQEGLTNVHKHAGARHVLVDLKLGEQDATLELSDDGRGFDPSGLQSFQPERGERYGLQGVRERLELVGGSLAVDSKQSEGTRLRVIVPKQPLVQSGTSLAGQSVAAASAPA